MKHNEEFNAANLKLKEEIKKSILSETEEKLEQEIDFLLLTDYDVETDTSYYDQSPIESLFILNIYKMLRGAKAYGTSKYLFDLTYFSFDPVFVFRAVVFSKDKENDSGTLLCISITKQYVIQHRNKRYKTDFFFQIYKGEKLGHLHSMSTPSAVAQLCVELDGHDYHERTKKQAQYDKQRDRDIKLAGYDIIHFTGSEVYKDWMSVFDQTIDMILSKVMK